MTNKMINLRPDQAQYLERLLQHNIDQASTGDVILIAELIKKLRGRMSNGTSSSTVGNNSSMVTKGKDILNV